MTKSVGKKVEQMTFDVTYVSDKTCHGVRRCHGELSFVLIEDMIIPFLTITIRKC